MRVWCSPVHRSSYQPGRTLAATEGLCLDRQTHTRTPTHSATVNWPLNISIHHYWENSAVFFQCDSRVDTFAHDFRAKKNESCALPTDSIDPLNIGFGLITIPHADKGQRKANRLLLTLRAWEHGRKTFSTGRGVCSHVYTLTATTVCRHWAGSQPYLTTLTW